MKQSELLRKQADMLEMAEKYGIDHWAKLVKLTDCNLYDWRVSIKELDKPLGIGADYTFALGVVEGRPVFEGDELYANEVKHTVISKHESAGSLQWIGKCVDGSDVKLGMPLDCWSWNPPKPKTVMVPMLVEDAKRFAIAGLAHEHLPLHNLCDSCIEALKQIEQ